LGIEIFFDLCENYINHVIKNKSATVEAHKYSESKLPAVTERIMKKLGVDNHKWNITTNDVTVMWELCTFEVAILGVEDQFCALFKDDEDAIEVMNYIADLTDYWKKGYGYEINYKIACPLIISFDQAIQSVVDYWEMNNNNNNVVGVTLRFAHAETIFPFVSLLGLFKDNFTLLANSTAEQIANRLWRGSIIAPFVGNVALVLYKCSSMKESQERAKYKWLVKLLHNEQELIIPGCDSVYCLLSTFRRIYNDALTRCDLNAMCNNNTQWWRSHN